MPCIMPLAPVMPARPVNAADPDPGVLLLDLKGARLAPREDRRGFVLVGEAPPRDEWDRPVDLE